jgi:hypothetical protein
MRRCRRATPSASRAAVLMNGWSPGTIARFGSLLFCSLIGGGGRGGGTITLSGRCDTKRTGWIAYPWIRNATRLHQYNSLQKLDCGKLYAGVRVGRPHELDDPVLRARECIPLEPLVPIRTSGKGSVGENVKASISVEHPNLFLPKKNLRNAHSTKEKRVHARESLYCDFDSPSVGVVQKCG